MSDLTILDRRLKALRDEPESSKLSLKDELMRRLAEGKADLSSPLAKRLVDSMIASTTLKMEALLAGLMRSEGTITMKLDYYEDLNKTKGEVKTSQTIHVFGLPWEAKLSFTTFDNSGNYALNLFVRYTDNETPTCEAEVEYRMKNQLNGRDFVRSVVNTFKSSREYGFPYFAYQREIEDPKFGYLVGDSLILEITIKAVQRA